jgi:hypothetical protein
MKSIKFITTFSKNGYDLYGQDWINTFTSNAKGDIKADIYVEFPLEVTDDRINIIDFDSVVPNHKDWTKQFQQTFKGDEYHRKMGVRFSFKSFVMMHALENNKDCYVIWLDGDCIYKPQTFETFPENVIQGKSIACQKEGNSGHVESGIVIFDVDHKDTKTFLTKFKENYLIENIIKMSSPFDGFVIGNTLKDTNIDFINLNNLFGKDGIQSDPTLTFLNPELKKRFVHNIGPTGKR